MVVTPVGGSEGKWWYPLLPFFLLVREVVHPDESPSSGT